MSFASDEEHDLFENAFLSFVNAVRVLSHDAEMQCEEMGNYNTPWEIQRDVTHGGLGIVSSSTTYLSWEQQQGITELVEALKALPEEAISPIGMLMTSHAGCIYAMNHPAWGPLREDAGQLLVLLEPAIRRNEAYFQAQ